MKRMNGVQMAMGFESSSDGGGAAVAPPPTRGGFFAGLDRATAVPSAPPPASATPPAATPAPVAAPAVPPVPPAAAAPTPPPAAAAPVAKAKVQVLSDDKKTVLGEFDSEEKAQEFIKNGGKTPAPAPAAVAPAAPAPAAETLTRPFMGRVDITTLSAAEVIYRKSQEEGIRLSGLVRQERAQAQAKITDYEAKLAAAQKELDLARKTPAIAEKTKEELVALAKENPYEFSEYMEAKRQRDTLVQTTRAQAEQEVRERAVQVAKAKDEIDANWKARLADPKKYPKFQELIPKIDDIYERSVVNGKSPFDLNPRGPEYLHMIALGEIYAELLAKGVEVQADAAEAARLKSESDAASARAAAGAGAGDGAAPVDAAKKEENEWRTRMRSTAPQPFLKTRATAKT